MKIEFPRRYATNYESVGIIFPALVDGKEIICKISQEALQDINPLNRLDSIEKQFKYNRTLINKIAEAKICNGEIEIFISSKDVIIK